MGEVYISTNARPVFQMCERLKRSSGADDLCRRNGTISGLPTIHGPNPLPILAMIPDLGG